MFTGREINWLARQGSSSTTDYQLLDVCPVEMKHHLLAGASHVSFVRV